MHVLVFSIQLPSNNIDLSTVRDVLGRFGGGFERHVWRFEGRCLERVRDVYAACSWHVWAAFVPCVGHISLFRVNREKVGCSKRGQVPESLGRVAIEPVASIITEDPAASVAGRKIANNELSNEFPTRVS